MKELEVELAAVLEGNRQLPTGEPEGEQFDTAIRQLSAGEFDQESIHAFCEQALRTILR